MKSDLFTSCQTPQMEAFCSLHRSLGADYTTPTARLRYFDRYLTQVGFGGEFPDLAIIDRYMSGLAHLEPATQAAYLATVRQYCLYLTRFHVDCQVPQRYRTPRSSEAFNPHIFTPDEIRGLIRAAEAFDSRDPLRGRTLKTLIGLLFTTGLRIAEALALNLEDIDRRDLRLFVRKGKFRKERWVPLSPSTGAALEFYLDRRSQRFLTTATSPLFPNIKGGRLSYTPARKAFRRLLCQTGIYSGVGQAPRLHDLRHSFAVSTLMREIKKGGDPNKILPALATFMGHVDVSSTQLYLHMTPELWRHAYETSLNYFQTHIEHGGA
ncbi:MAG: tyrosine-type recombinase/integrase [Acidobacteriota bacterium]|nr:tyrosine-type recombinase/integrase [Acidobacteriota bacterium]